MLSPKPIDLLAALNRDYLKQFGVKSVQLFSLLSNNLLELKAESGEPEKFVASRMKQSKLEELEHLVSSENICKEISQAGYLLEPGASLMVAPFSTGATLKGFFIVEWKAQELISEEAKEAVSIYSALSSVYFTQHAAFADLDSGFDTTAKQQTLSPRQLQVLRGMVEGKTNHELATDLGFSVSTIRHETMAIFRVLGVSDRKEAAKAAQQMELIN
jgi:DNA-binding CsgD family transcriptional regulator